jgi:hypothetical protein
MKPKAITGDYQFYVDPMYYGFQWTEAMYITVQYSAIKEGDSVVASANAITAAPWLLGSINMRGNWMAVDKEITTATQVHAEKEFARNNQVHDTIMEAIAPFI